MRGIFITGTDTNVGKTVVAAALLHRFRSRVLLCYWKPIQTGIEEADDTATVRRLGQCAAGEILDSGVRLREPLAPYFAARRAGQTIELDSLTRMIAAAGFTGSYLVEGAGGLLVPINERQMMSDLIQELGLPVLVVARSSLGTINHTLMTLERLRHRSIHIAGVVMSGEPNAENREAIECFGCTQVLGELPFLMPLDAQCLRAWAQTALDREGALMEFFR